LARKKKKKKQKTLKHSQREVKDHPKSGFLEQNNSDIKGQKLGKKQTSLGGSNKSQLAPAREK